MKDLVIFGTGGFGREVHELVEDACADGARWAFAGFLDGNAATHGTDVHGHPVLGGAEWMAAHPGTAVVVAVADTGAKRRVVEALVRHGATAFPTLVHPRAWVGRRVRVGAGCVICAGTTATTDVVIEDHVILNLSCTVGHDAHLGRYTTVAPGVSISGAVVVGEGCNLGTRSAIIQGITVGAGTVVGAGAIVTRDLPANVVAVGMPAKPIKETPEAW